MLRSGNCKSRATRLLWALTPALVLVGACTTGQSSTNCRNLLGPAVFERRVETVSRSGRPKLVSVERDGDPAPAATLAVAVAGGAEVAWALAALAELRLTESGFTANATAHGAGFWIHTLLKDPEDAKRFVREASRIITTPVAANQPLTTIRARIAAAKLARSNDADLDVAACSADPVLGPSSELLSNTDPEARVQLEHWRASLSTQTVALAVVGSKPVLDAANEELARSTAVLATAPPESFDHWPDGDSLRTTAATGGASTLSIALRIPDVASAQWAAKQLVDDETSLRVVGAAFEPPWHLDRVIAVGRPRGACLRVDLRNVAGASLDQAAALAAFATGEMKRLLPRADSSAWIFQDAILRLDDPREAADVAAWQALSGNLETGEARFAVSYSAPGPDISAARFKQAQIEWAKRSSTDFLESQSAFEPGHSKLTVLLASPCGTLGESSDDAGELAVMANAMAQGTGNTIHLSPWVTSDAVGLLVESDPLSSDETPNAQAERTSGELARALLAPLEGKAIYAARQSILESFVKPTPDWWLAIETLAPNQLSALSPQGSWTSVGSLVNDQIVAARRLFATGPLRIAVLAGGSKEQAQIVHDELSRVLSPLRPADRKCPVPEPIKPGNGLFRLEAVTDPLAQALLAVSFPPASHWSRASEAEWTVFLLNRKGGWLDRRLIASGLAVDAQAHLLGGRRTRALIIDLHTFDEKTDAAITEARRLLLDLAGGAVTAPDLQAANDFFNEQQLEHSLDPRQRVVALWQGGGEAPHPTLESMRRLHADAFREARHLVVIAQ